MKSAYAWRSGSSAPSPGLPRSWAAHSGQNLDDAGIVDEQRLHRTTSDSNSAPHFGQVLASSGTRLPHSPHSTSLPAAWRRVRSRNPTAATTIAAAIVIQSQSGSPRYLWVKRLDTGGAGTTNDPGVPMV